MLMCFNSKEEGCPGIVLQKTRRFTARSTQHLGLMELTFSSALRSARPFSTKVLTTFRYPCLAAYIRADIPSCKEKNYLVRFSRKLYLILSVGVHFLVHTQVPDYATAPLETCYVESSHPILCMVSESLSRSYDHDCVLSAHLLLVVDSGAMIYQVAGNSLMSILYGQHHGRPPVLLDRYK